VERAGEVGRYLGIAYQLVDDINGVFGDSTITGKSTLSDLRSGKQTPLIAHARTTAHWPDIAPYVGRADLSDVQAACVRQLLTDNGSLRFVEELAGVYADGALTLCREMEMPPALVTWIDAMATDLLTRAA
jgi:geranylgeranyl diphosphate synthase type II